MSKIKRVTTNRYEKDLKLTIKQGKNINKLLLILNTLISGLEGAVSHYKLLPDKYKLHRLKGEFKDSWECHIEPDWLLIFQITESSIILERTGSHSYLFKK